MKNSKHLDKEKVKLENDLKGLKTQFETKKKADDKSIKDLKNNMNITQNIWKVLLREILKQKVVELKSLKKTKIDENGFIKLINSTISDLKLKDPVNEFVNKIELLDKILVMKDEATVKFGLICTIGNL